MARINYEFPLNEKIRTYLRIEQLFIRMQESACILTEASLIGYFKALFDITEVIERGDLKGDLLKDLERHEKNLITWSQHPDIDSSAINVLLEQIIQGNNALAKSGRLGSEIKDDRFLSSIKQRFTIPGGTSCFDLPQLHHWLYQSDEKKRQDLAVFDGYLATLKQVIKLDLRFVREQGQQQVVTAINGLYQDATDSTELLQIDIDADCPAFPTVSGNKHRFTIRFMETCNESGKSSSDIDIPFILTSC
jgi:cell division protein ZapD